MWSALLVALSSAVVAAGAPARGDVRIGADVAPAVAECLQAHLARFHIDGVVAIGDTPLTRAVIDASSVAGLPDEAFILKVGVVDGVRVLAADGRGRGKSYAAYAALEALGFRFLHPLAPRSPDRGALLAIPDVDVREAPALKVRNLHLHTQHPLELTELLEALADSPDEAADRAHFDALLEWLLANRQNELEWLLLEPPGSAATSMGPQRAKRLRALVERAHAFGLRVGVDAPIALVQQHAFRLVPHAGGSLDDELAQLKARTDWLIALGFDFLSTESGSTELTHPSATRMLAWMNALTAEAATRGVDVRIKVHCSAGQRADGFTDVHTGEPLDFNFLPMHADRRLAVLPHTVQMYALDDAAPTYGNKDFRALRQFIVDTAGTRPVVWYPESAYWVSVDVDVPLFLPVYARARLHDLDLLAEEPLDGQSLFSSGWEWGFWLNDVVAARGAWKRPGSLQDALGPLLDPRLADIVGGVADDEHALLVRTGAMGALLGRDGYDDLFAAIGVTQSQAPRTVDDRALATAEAALARRQPALDLLVRAGIPESAELADALAVTVLRIQHVRAVESGDLARASLLRAQALRHVRAREGAYRMPVARLASWRASSTTYAFGYLATVHELFYWWRDEETARRHPWLPCHDNLVDGPDFIFGTVAPGAGGAAPSMRGGSFLDDLASCVRGSP